MTYFGGISGKYRSSDDCRHSGVPLQLSCRCYRSDKQLLSLKMLTFGV